MATEYTLQQLHAIDILNIIDSKIYYNSCELSALEARTKSRNIAYNKARHLAHDMIQEATRYNRIACALNEKYFTANGFAGKYNDWSGIISRAAAFFGENN